MIQDIAKIVLDYNDEKSTKIYSIFKTGSQLLRQNPTDLDFIVVVDKLETVSNGRFKRSKRDNGNVYDFFFIEIGELTNLYNFDAVNYTNEMKLYAYLHLPNIREIVYDSGEVILPEFNIFENKNHYINLLKVVMFDGINRAVNKEVVLGKVYVHLYSVLKIYENNTPLITISMKQDIENLYNSTGNFMELCHWIENKLLESEEPENGSDD